MIKTLRYSLMAALMFVCGSMFAQDVTFDFTSNDGWNLPTENTKDKQSFTNNGYTITLEGGTAGNGYRFSTFKGDSYLIMGQTNSTLTLPAFDFAVSKIEVVGHDGASAAVKQNIFVGTTAVSTETTGAADADKKALTNTYEINADYQAAGNVYVLKVTSKHNTQITAINIYKATGATKKSAELAFSEETVNYETGTTFTAPTFTKATTAAVTFASDNEAVATVNAEGVIALGGEEGKAVITATSEANDEYNAGSATCTVYVYHMNVYKKAETVESGKKYLIVAQRDDKTYYAFPGQESYTYGYLKSGEVEGTVDEISVKSSYDDAFTFEDCEDGFSIKDCYGRYLYMDDDHASFQFGTDAQAWTVEPAENGTFTITNNSKFIQWGDGTYTTFGAYAEKKETTVLPMLYLFDETASAINTIETSVKAQNNARYNIAGQRVNDNFKGIVIVNGKKTLVK